MNQAKRKKMLRIFNWSMTNDVHVRCWIRAINRCTNVCFVEWCFVTYTKKRKTIVIEPLMISQTAMNRSKGQSERKRKPIIIPDRGMLVINRSQILVKCEDLSSAAVGTINVWLFLSLTTMLLNWGCIAFVFISVGGNFRCRSSIDGKSRVIINILGVSFISK